MAHRGQFPEREYDRLEVWPISRPMTIEACNYLPKDRRQFRFPRTKKRRIRRKWERNPANYRMESPRHAFMIGTTIYCAPDRVYWIVKRLKKLLATAAIKDDSIDLLSERRGRREPAAYITGLREVHAEIMLNFDGHSLLKTDGFPIPKIRGPQADGLSEYLQMIRGRMHCGDMF